MEKINQVGRNLAFLSFASMHLCSVKQIDMDRLTTTMFFTLAHDGYEPSASNLEIEYYNFAQSLYLLCRDAADPLRTYFTLTYTSIELHALGSSNGYVVKAMELVDGALRWQQEHSKSLQQSEGIPAYSRSDNSFVWTGKSVQLVELAYSFAEMRCVNNGDVGITELIEYMAAMFGIEIKDCFGAYCDIKRRKGDSRTYFLDQLRERLNERIERDEQK